MSITAKDVYDALFDQIGETGSYGFLEHYEEGDDLRSVTVDGVVNCRAVAEFLEARWSKQEKKDKT